VGVTTVRELYGVTMAEKAEVGILATSGVFTAEAKEWAKDKTIDLIDAERLCRLIGHIQPVQFVPPAVSPAPTTPTCPKCGEAMVLRTAKKGANAGSQFWGCSAYPACKGTRNAQTQQTS
jgi:restriction system protein